MAWLPSFTRHRGEEVGKGNAEGVMVTALNLPFAELVQEEPEMKEGKARAHQEQEGRRDVLRH
jgi:hypothetical protein